MLPSRLFRHASHQPDRDSEAGTPIGSRRGRLIACGWLAGSLLGCQVLTQLVGMGSASAQGTLPSPVQPPPRPGAAQARPAVQAPARPGLQPPTRPAAPVQPGVAPARPAVVPAAQPAAAGAVAVGPAREWKSAKGQVVLTGSFVAANDATVVIEKPTGELVGVKLEELSEADRKLAQELRLAEVQAKSESEAKRAEERAYDPHVWTTRDGVKLKGRVTSFARKDVTYRRNTGVTMVNEHPFSKLPAYYQDVAIRIVGQMADPNVKTEADLTRWARSLRGQPKTFSVEGVILRLEDNTELPIPFFLLSDDDLKILRPGWDAWKKQDADEESRKRESFLLEVQAQQYQEDRAMTQQIQMMNMQYMAVATGLTRIWEVYLYPPAGVYARPMAVVVNALDNVQAQQVASMMYPGYFVGPVRKLSP